MDFAEFRLWEDIGLDDICIQGRILARVFWRLSLYPVVQELGVSSGVLLLCLDVYGADGKAREVFDGRPVDAPFLSDMFFGGCMACGRLGAWFAFAGHGEGGRGGALFGRARQATTRLWGYCGTSAGRRQWRRRLQTALGGAEVAQCGVTVWRQYTLRDEVKGRIKFGRDDRNRPASRGQTRWFRRGRVDALSAVGQSRGLGLR